MLRDRLRPEYAVAAVFVAAAFMNILDSTIVNVALPTIARDFHVSVSSTDSVIIGYLVSLAVWIPASGWVGDRLGTKRTFLAALVLFTVASALCGLATGLGQLVAFRVLQGVGGGMLNPVGTAMLFRAFPPERRARAAQVLVVPTVVAPAVGPVLGGLLVDQLSWRWAFYINLPIGLAALLFGLVFLHEHREPTAGRFDLVGFVLAGAGLALVLYTLSVAPALGWGSVPVVAAGVGGLLALALFVWVEPRQAAPLLDLRLFANRLFRATNGASLCASAAFVGMLFAVPLFLQDLVGTSALTSGLTTFPEAIGVLMSSQVVGRLYPRVGPRRLMAAGLFWVAMAMASFSLVRLDADLWLIRLGMWCIGVGMACVFLPVQAAAFATISSRDTGRASALFNAQNRVGAALGVAVLASVLGVQAGGAPSDLSGPLAAFQRAFLVAAGMALAGSLLSLTVSDRDAANTMRPRRSGDVPEPEAVATAP